ncbi:hypothetical protein QCA50_003690 [Cerrena zonata]|uniref:ubiquitinyl hydrolase 1 n=1 Tax=Cerrena zonata TaxID=2478898 RepID=A0AAW0GSU6_9APHY
MLQLDNEALARHWLSLYPKSGTIRAAVFFSEEDELVVVTQNGKNAEPLHSSPFKQRLDECVVYLDDAHTCGTDLKLPRDARAVVTLGPKVTKDRLVQACMRMRKLGHGQSVMFCAPPEIDRRIREITNLSPDVSPRVDNIIRWAISETSSEIERSIPQWAQQGVEHNRRKKAYETYSASSDVETLCDAWRQRESKTLEELYGLQATPDDDTEHPAFQVPDIKSRLESFGISRLSSTGYGEEQEREVSQEVEQEREVERPPKAKPAKPFLHEDVRTFIATGHLNVASGQFIPATNMLQLQSAHLESTWSMGLYMTQDFTRTIQSAGPQSPLDFIRPMNWIISGTDDRKNPIFVVMSPHEVNELLPDIRKSFNSRLHMFNPRVTEWMKSFSDLSFYTISGAIQSSLNLPSREIQSQLSLLSGQVYLDNMEIYYEVERLLRIRRVDRNGSTHMECDGAVLEWIQSYRAE